MKKILYLFILLNLLLLSSCNNNNKDNYKHIITYKYQDDIIDVIKTNNDNITISPFENDYVKTIYYQDENSNKYYVGDDVIFSESIIELEAFVISKYQDDLKYEIKDNEVILTTLISEQEFVYLPNLFLIDNNYYKVTGMYNSLLENYDNIISSNVYRILIPKEIINIYHPMYITGINSYPGKYILFNEYYFPNLKIVYFLTPKYSEFYKSTNVELTRYSKLDYIEYDGDFVFFHQMIDEKESYLINYIGNDTNIILPDKDKPYILGTYFLYKNNDVQYLTLSSSVKEIKQYAIQSCDSLRKIDMKEGNLISIGHNIIGYCKNLYYIRLADSIKQLSINFLSGVNLNSLVLPSKLETVDYSNIKQAKNNFEYLEEIYYLPNRIIDFPIEEMSDNYKNITIHRKLSEKSNLEEYNDSLFTKKDGKIYLLRPFNNIKHDYTIFKLPEYYNMEPYYIFNDYFKLADDEIKESLVNPNSIKTLIIPSYVYEVPDNFAEYIFFEKLIIEDGVTSIGENAFYNNFYLKEVTLPPSLKTIGASCFELCQNLYRINIPKSVETIGANALKFTTSLYELINESNLDLNVGSNLYNEIKGTYQKVVTSINDSKLKIDDNYIYYDEDIIILLKYIGPRIDTLVLPDNIDEKEYKIYNFIHNYESRIRTLVIPKTVKHISLVSAVHLLLSYDTVVITNKELIIDNWSLKTKIEFYGTADDYKYFYDNNPIIKDNYYFDISRVTLL